jgi:hypothetical protein
VEKAEKEEKVEKQSMEKKHLNQNQLEQDFNFQ